MKGGDQTPAPPDSSDFGGGFSVGHVCKAAGRAGRIVLSSTPSAWMMIPFRFSVSSPCPRLLGAGREGGFIASPSVGRPGADSERSTHHRPGVRTGTGLPGLWRKVTHSSRRGMVRRTHLGKGCRPAGWSKRDSRPKTAEGRQTFYRCSRREAP